MARHHDKQPKKILQALTLFLILLPQNGVRHSPIATRCVKIKSEDIYACSQDDFLTLCKEIFGEKGGKLNFIYDQDGNNIESIKQIKDRSLVFLKRDHGFNLSEKDFSHVIRSLEREQRTRTRPFLSKLDPSGVSKLNSNAKSNYAKLIREQLEKESQLDEYTLVPQRGRVVEGRKASVERKLWRYAGKVMEMEQKLELKPESDE